jgi:hypothetical protein
MTKQDLEAFQNAIDCIGKGLDALMDLACAIEAKAKRKSPKTKKTRASK